MAFVSAQSARAAYCGRLGYDVEQGLKVFMGLVTAPAMACALDALVKDTIGVSNRSIVVGWLGSAGYLAVILAFASRRSAKVRLRMIC